MLRTLSAGMTALVVVAGSSLAYAQGPSAAAPASQRVTAADLNNLTDARVNVVKAALQLTPDQERYWPAIEDAIRTRAKDRQPGCKTRQHAPQNSETAVLSKSCATVIPSSF